MSIRHNAEEVLQIAIRVEQNGARFYREAAARADAAAVRERFAELADWEDRHEKLFREMLGQTRNRTRRFCLDDLDDAAGLYLQAIADGAIFPTADGGWASEPPAADLAGLLRQALAREKDAVIFFVAMEATAAADEDRQRLHELVLEEMAHVRIIADELAKL